MALLNPNQVEGYSGENILLNPSFLQIQRAAYKDNPTEDYHSVDMWRSARESYSGNCRIGRSTVTGPNSQSCLYLRRNNADTSGSAFIVQQQIEAYRMVALWGKTLTVSFKVYKDSNWQWNSGRVQLFSGTSTNQTTSTQAYLSNLTGSTELIDEYLTEPASGETWETWAFTTSAPLAAGTATLILRFIFDVTGTQASDASFRIGEVKLEVGSKVTPYVEPDRMLDLLRCQRYFQQNIGGTESQPVFSFDVTSGQVYYVHVPLISQMMGTPTITVTLGNGSLLGSLTSAIASDTGFRAGMTATGTGRAFARFQWTADSSL